VYTTKCSMIVLSKTAAAHSTYFWALIVSQSVEGFLQGSGPSAPLASNDARLIGTRISSYAFSEISGVHGPKFHTTGNNV
jgi:hypothetical protein